MTKKIIITGILIIIIILTMKHSISYAREDENLAGENTTSGVDITTNFKDENLRNAILELAKEATDDENKTQIYETDIDEIVKDTGGTSLRLANKGIKDLSGLEAFAGKGITWIFLDWNEITDLTPLSNFDELTKISFSGNNVTDLTPLENLSNLNNITAINNKIETLQPISNLKNIRYICLDGNNLTSINEINNWTKLEEISVADSNIDKLPDMQNLINIRKLNLGNNNINTIKEMNNLETLVDFQINDNELETLEGIENLSNLQILNCSNNKINNLSGIEHLESLENLNLNVNQITDISVLANNKNLKFIYLDNNKTLDFSVLEKLENLEKYTIYNQKISVEIKEKINSNYVLIPLPDLYTNLYDPNSFLYNGNLETQLEGNQEFEINDNNTQIQLKTEDLENGPIVVKVMDENNTILTYEITLDKKPPTIQGVEDGEVYTNPITITTEDKDIETIKLTKDNLEIEYSLGDELEQEGKYILEVTDYAGNKTIIKFEIKENFSEQSQNYEIEGNYIVGITENTTLEQFKINLNGNVEYDIYRNEEILNNGQVISTGDVLTTRLGNNYYIIVQGDCNKDGVCDITDLLILKRYILQMLTLDEYSMKAVDLNEDDVTDITDVNILRRMLVK